MDLSGSMTFLFGLGSLPFVLESIIASSSLTFRQHGTHTFGAIPARRIEELYSLVRVGQLH